jgi:hypothetical protein
MALGIHEEGIHTIFSIPLEWERNEILAGHLRMLADAIENNNVIIEDVRLRVPINQPYNKPSLDFVSFVK